MGVRVVGLSLYLRVAWSKPKMRQAVKTFGALSVGGLATALLGGFLGGSALLYLWGMTIFLGLRGGDVVGRHRGVGDSP